MNVDFSPDRRIRILAIVIFVMVTGIGAILGYIYYHLEKEKVILAQSETLEAINQLKAANIQSWREDRIAEANRIAHKRALVELISRPEREARWRNELQTFLLGEAADRKQVAAFLLDPELNVLARTENIGTYPMPPARLPPGSSLRGPGILGFYRGSGGVIYVEIAVPVRNAANQIQAVLVARKDANIAFSPSSDSGQLSVQAREPISSNAKVTKFFL